MEIRKVPSLKNTASILYFLFFPSAVTNGKHQWVPKEIAEAAEKYAKVSWGKQVKLGEKFVAYM